MVMGAIMGDKTLPITGGCLCGAVRYEANEPPGDYGGYCHCRMCQKAYGSGFSAYVDFASDAFRFTLGEPKLYKSSNSGERGFCANCGSPLISRYFQYERTWVFVGTLDHPDEVREYMRVHLGIESEISWLTTHDDLPRKCTEEESLYTSLGLSVDQGRE